GIGMLASRPEAVRRSGRVLAARPDPALTERERGTEEQGSPDWSAIPALTRNASENNALAAHAPRPPPLPAPAPRAGRPGARRGRGRLPIPTGTARAARRQPAPPHARRQRAGPTSLSRRRRRRRGLAADHAQPDQASRDADPDAVEPGLGRRPESDHARAGR